MKIFFVSKLKYINYFYRMDIYILSNESNFHQMKVCFCRMKVVFVEFYYILATIHFMYKCVLLP